MKNFGIDGEELEEIYTSLMEKGYIETYEQFINNNPEFNGEGCSGCGSSRCSSCGNNGKDIDYSKIKVLTKKTIDELK